VAPSGEYESWFQMSLGNSSWRLITEQNSHKITITYSDTWSDFVMKSMFKYYLNILLYHGVKTTRPFADAHDQKHAMLHAAWEREFVEPDICGRQLRTSIWLITPCRVPAADGLPPSKFRLSWRTQTSICKGIWRNSASRRLNAVVQQNGGHIEHVFK